MRMASALVHSVGVILCVTFTCTSAVIEIRPSRLVVEEGQSDEFMICTFKLPSDRSCFRSVQWIFINQPGAETTIANIDSVKIGPYMDYFEASYHESTNAATNYKECTYYLDFINVTSELNGQYRCMVNKQMSKWANAIVISNVEALAPKCKIRVTNITHIVQDVELICSAYPVNPSNPAIRLAWLFRGERIPSTNNTSEMGLMTTKSQLMPRNDSSSRIEYTCKAYNRSGFPLDKSCSITCYVNISIHVTMAYESGRPKGTFQCPFKTSLDGIRYSRQWTLGGERINLENQTDRFIAEDHTGSLHMTDILASDNGKTLTCKVNTMFGVYKAETLIVWEDPSLPATRGPLDSGPPPTGLSLYMIVIIAVGVTLVVFINVFVCMVIVRSRGKRSRTMNQPVATAVSQDEGLYASGIVPCNGYLHMNGTYAGSYDPEEPYQDMAEEGTKRDSEYQVPKVNVDGSAIKKKQSVKYMNTLGGGKNKGFNVFRFSRRKEEKYNKSNSLEVGACGGGAEGSDQPPISPNCYDAPKYNCESGLQVPSNKTQENDYDELNLKSESADEI